MSDLKKMAESWAKTFLATALATYLAVGLDVDAIANAALVSVLPSIINWLNPNYERYGRVGGPVVHEVAPPCLDAVGALGEQLVAQVLQAQQGVGGIACRARSGYAAPEGLVGSHGSLLRHGSGRPCLFAFTRWSLARQAPPG